MNEFDLSKPTGDWAMAAQMDIIRPHAVYEAIAIITGELATVGISKGRKNAQQGYQFRGIDDVYGALSRLLATHKLCAIPRVISRSVTERETKSGGVLFYVVLEVEYDLVSAVDGSIHTARTIGEAMDSADKATNKAMSAAYKYMALQVFCIPTEGDNDADAQTHEVRAKGKPAGYDGIIADLRAVADEGTQKLKAAWDKQREDVRIYATTQDAKRWADIKTIAAKVKESVAA